MLIWWRCYRKETSRDWDVNDYLTKNCTTNFLDYKKFRLHAHEGTQFHFIADKKHPFHLPVGLVRAYHRWVIDSCWYFECQVVELNQTEVSSSRAFFRHCFLCTQHFSYVQLQMLSTGESWLSAVVFRSNLLRIPQSSQFSSQHFRLYQLNPDSSDHRGWTRASATARFIRILLFLLVEKDSVALVLSATWTASSSRI